MTIQEISIETEDHFWLSATLRIPEQMPEGFIQINPGTGIPAGFYSRFANHFAERGFVVVSYDYRGIGKSKPGKLKGFNATNLDWGTLDATAVLNWALQHYPHLRKIVIGHSMGGQLIGTMKNASRIDETVIIASGTGYWRDMPPSKMKKLMPFLFKFYLPLSTFFLGYGNAKKIRQGENLPAGVATQWRKWCLQHNYWADDLKDNKRSDNFSDVRGKLTSVLIADDHHVSQKSNVKLLQHYSNASVERKTIAPKDVGRERLGHFGFFRKTAEPLWKELLLAE